MINVVIADGHPIVRRGFRQAMESTTDIRVVAECADAASLLAWLRAGVCDVVVVEPMLCDMQGIEVVHALRTRYPRVVVLVLTSYPEQQLGMRALRAGAAGFFHKRQPVDDLPTAVRAVAQGRRYFSDMLAQLLAAHVLSDAGSENDLSAREFEVLRLLARGERATRIATSLHISIKTVSTHRRRAFQKLGLDNNAQLVRRAMEMGWLI